MSVMRSGDVSQSPTVILRRKHHVQHCLNILQTTGLKFKFRSRNIFTVFINYKNIRRLSISYIFIDTKYFSTISNRIDLLISNDVPNFRVRKYKSLYVSKSGSKFDTLLLNCQSSSRSGNTLYLAVVNFTYFTKK